MNLQKMQFRGEDTDAWRKFTQTGDIQDYLAYRGLANTVAGYDAGKGEPIEGAAENRGDSPAGSADGR